MELELASMQNKAKYEAVSTIQEGLSDLSRQRQMIKAEMANLEKQKEQLAEEVLQLKQTYLRTRKTMAYTGKVATMANSNHHIDLSISST